MPFTRPTGGYPEFASTATGTDIAEPDAAKKQAGWAYQEKPNRQWLNWLHKLIWQWIGWIDEELMSPGTGDSGLGTAAAKDTGTASGDVPLFGADKALDVNSINPTISHASDTGVVTTGTRRAVSVSDSCQDSGDRAQVNASTSSEATGTRSQVNASYDGDAAGVDSVISASSSSDISSNANDALIAGGDQCKIDDSSYAVVLAAKKTLASGDYKVCGGTAASGDPATANRTWELDSAAGNIYGTGTVAGGHTFTDFAEYFENLEAGIIPLGTVVTLEGRGIRPAQAGDWILGVISATAAFVCGDTPFTWAQRWLKGEFGEAVYEEIEEPRTENRKPKKIKVRKENPEYDPSKEQKPRSERAEEWSCVALIGQVHVRVGAEVKPGDFVNAAGGAVKRETRLLCMEIKQEFDAAKGYAVGLCLLR